MIIYKSSRLVYPSNIQSETGYNIVDIKSLSSTMLDDFEEIEVC